MEDLLDQRHKIAGAMKRMLNRKLSMAWEQWQFWYDQVHAAPHKPRHKPAPKTPGHPHSHPQVIGQQMRLAGAIRRMLNRKLSMAWEQWQFWYSNLIEQKRKLKRALAR